MLEIKNVSKIYKTKGGVETRALDGVSISFGETGLVFLLGKSGSGKSTLLNVCGGLDEPTSGEVIVKGKSSKEFSGSDFDSYRNTFVGFIFQEYNILDEFNVEDNVALALELQGKPKGRDKIYSLLKEVELDSYAKRKPNTLSGGQKQRIAIARALVKDPQIIMADEPTGALDSATGRQVFETLKKLSQTRLVIVVSHDREFAEVYGDRIVELKDGKIISDVSKVSVAPTEMDENVSVIGGNTLSIKSGANLTKKNIKTIQDFILNTDSDVIITKGETEISAFKKANRMDETGATEHFDDTPADAVRLKEYAKEDSKFIRSRLPAAKAIKIGAAGLKLKPVRLVFTILLSVIAFTMFGLFSTLMVYDGDKVAAKSFAESDTEYFNLSKSYAYKYRESNDWFNSSSADFTPDEYEYFKKEFSAGSVCYYTVAENVQNVRTENASFTYYYHTGINNYAYIPENHFLREKIVYGSYPVNDNEICISTYYLEVLKNSDYYNANADGVYSSMSTDKVKINDASDAVGKYLACNFTGGDIRAMKISGVFDSGKIPDEYDELKREDSDDYMLAAKFNYVLSENLHQFAFVSQTYHNNNQPRKELFNNGYRGQLTGEWERGEYSTDFHIQGLQSYGSESLPVIFTGEEKAELADDEIIVSVNFITYMYLHGDYLDAKWQEIIERLIEDNPDWDYDYAYDYSWVEYDEYCRKFDNYVDALAGSKIWVENNYIEPSKEFLKEAEAAVKEMIAFVDDFSLTVHHNYYDAATEMRDKYTFKIVGFFTDYGKITDGDYRYNCYLSENFIDSHLAYESYEQNYITNYKPTGEEIYSGIIIPYDHTTDTYNRLSHLLGEDNRNENDVYYELNSFLYMTVENANFYAEVLKTVFLWVGIVFAVFASLLMFNFISVSISNKRKEIGILRAVGARGLDVFKIFFSEAGIITAICTVLALIGTVSACVILNSVIKSLLGMSIALFVFGFATVGMMLAIAILVAFISTFLPVFLAARKKPVDSIRAL